MRSEVIIHQIADNNETVIFRTEKLIEAPNWPPDGTYLIVNGDGLIFRLDLDHPETLHHIDTAPVVHCNNDHGISPDGTTLVISDSPGRGTSLIYTLPITGGTPKLVTPNAPSYWHGWSPDGKTLTYTARRITPLMANGYGSTPTIMAARQSFGGCERTAASWNA